MSLREFLCGESKWQLEPLSICAEHLIGGDDHRHSAVVAQRIAQLTERRVHIDEVLY